MIAIVHFGISENHWSAVVPVWPTLGVRYPQKEPCDQYDREKLNKMVDRDRQKPIADRRQRKRQRHRSGVSIISVSSVSMSWAAISANILFVE